MARRSPAVRNTKEEIAQAALELFCERGYHEITVDEIAARAGVTKGAFYYYFADKEDVARDLWQDLWAHLATEAQKAIDPEADLATNLKQCFRTVLEGISSLGAAQFFLRDAWVLPSVEVAGREDQKAARSLVGSLLEEAVSKGEIEISNVNAAAAILLGAYAEAVLYILDSEDATSALEVLDTVVDALAKPARQQGRAKGALTARTRRTPTKGAGTD
jgi:AcrR family transcriptional regulator